MTDTVRLRATGATTDIVHKDQHFAPDFDGIFTVPADAAIELMRMPLGLEIAPDAQPEAAARTVDFLAPAPFLVFNVGVLPRYEADENRIVSGVAPEHCTHMLRCGCVPLPPVGWVDPRAKA